MGIYWNYGRLLELWAFIGIITFLWDGGGCLLEIIVFADGTKCPKSAVFVDIAAIVLLEKGNVN